MFEEVFEEVWVGFSTTYEYFCSFWQMSDILHKKYSLQKHSVGENTISYDLKNHSQELTIITWAYMLKCTFSFFCSPSVYLFSKYSCLMPYRSLYINTPVKLNPYGRGLWADLGLSDTLFCQNPMYGWIALYKNSLDYHIKCDSHWFLSDIPSMSAWVGVLAHFRK